MFFDTKAFAAMQNGLQASYLIQKYAQQNLANIDTPHYKAKSVVFEDLLADASKKTDRYSFVTSLVQHDSLKNRLDENNVDADNESLTLYKGYVQYSYLTSKINSEFSNLRYVFNNAFK